MTNTDRAGSRNQIQIRMSSEKKKQVKRDFQIGVAVRKTQWL